MGCCGKDKGCQSEPKKRSIPWFAIICTVLVLLVVINWQ
ncbi:DUF1523 family protein [Vibrio scophthalmi]|nr:DUF1523 family protein [Vibrio scophthalmi]